MNSNVNRTHPEPNLTSAIRSDAFVKIHCLADLLRYIVLNCVHSKSAQCRANFSAVSLPQTDQDMQSSGFFAYLKPGVNILKAPSQELACHKIETIQLLT